MDSNIAQSPYVLQVVEPAPEETGAPASLGFVGWAAISMLAAFVAMMLIFWALSCLLHKHRK